MSLVKKRQSGEDEEQEGTREIAKREGKSERDREKRNAGVRDRGREQEAE